MELTSNKEKRWWRQLQVHLQQKRGEEEDTSKSISDIIQSVHVTGLALKEEELHDNKEVAIVPSVCNWKRDL